MRLLSILTVLLLAAAAARADVVYLKNGKSIEGRVTVGEDKVTVELPYGTVSFPRDKVLRIERKESSVEAYERKYRELPAGDAAARLALAGWCRRQGMGPRAEALLREVLEFEADNAEARRLLGYIRHEDRWVTPEERNRQIGLVEFEGQWHKSESVAAIKAARAEALRAEEERRKAEVDLRLREAEIEGLRAERRRLEAERLRLETERAELAAERLRLERTFLRYPNFRQVGGSVYFYPNFPDTRQGIIIIRSGSPKPPEPRPGEVKPPPAETETEPEPKAGTGVRESAPAEDDPAGAPTAPGTAAPPS